MPPRKTRKPKHVKKRIAPTGPRVKWHGVKAPPLVKGRDGDRSYKLETLTSALEKLMQTRDRWFMPSFKEILGNVPITVINGKLVAEDRYTLTLRLTATAATKKRASIVVVASKRPGENSERLEREQQNLRHMHQLHPKGVVPAQRGGLAYLPDRQRRPGMDREVYFYITSWSPSSVPLGVGKNGQFVTVGEKRQLCRAVETEHIKAKILEILVGTYNDTTRSGMDMRELKLDDFLVLKSAKGQPRVILRACRSIQQQQPMVFLDRILRKEWEDDAGVIGLCLNDPDALWNALKAGLGKETAVKWVSMYLALPKSRRRAALSKDYLDALRDYGAE